MPAFSTQPGSCPLLPPCFAPCAAPAVPACRPLTASASSAPPPSCTWMSRRQPPLATRVSEAAELRRAPPGSAGHAHASRPAWQPASACAPVSVRQHAASQGIAGAEAPRRITAAKIPGRSSAHSRSRYARGAPCMPAKQRCPAPPHSNHGLRNRWHARWRRHPRHTTAQDHRHGHAHHGRPQRKRSPARRRPSCCCSCRALAASGAGPLWPTTRPPACRLHRLAATCSCALRSPPTPRPRSTASQRGRATRQDLAPPAPLGPTPPLPMACEQLGMWEQGSARPSSVQAGVHGSAAR